MSFISLDNKKNTVNNLQDSSLIRPAVADCLEPGQGGIEISSGTETGHLGHSTRSVFPLPGENGLPSASSRIAEGGLVLEQGTRQPTKSLSGRRGNGSRERKMRDGTGQATQPVPNSQNSSDSWYKIPGARGTESPQSSPFLPYKDSYANPATLERDSKLKSSCKKYMIYGQCENEDMTLVKVLYCGLEWCPDCGQEWSIAHQRRFSRLLPKAMQMEKMGSWVIEYPDRYRHIKYRCYSKQGLRNTASAVVDVLAGVRKGRKGRVGGYSSRGLLRWHFYGDKRPGKYNPHLNVITDTGFIGNEKLAEIKAALRKALNCPDLIVFYEYTHEPHSMIHQLKYITRATFLERDWDNYMADELYGFRNIRWWGDWSMEPVWGSEGQEYYLDIEKMERCKCPKCGGHLTWSKPSDSSALRSWDDAGKVTPLGGGYFEIDTGKYSGPFKGVEVVEELDPVTGELKPVENSFMRKKLLRGDYDRLAEMVDMGRRRAKFTEDCLRLGIDWRRDPCSDYENDPEYWAE